MSWKSKINRKLTPDETLIIVLICLLVFGILANDPLLGFKFSSILVVHGLNAIAVFAPYILVVALAVYGYRWMRSQEKDQSTNESDETAEAERINEAAHSVLGVISFVGKAILVVMLAFFALIVLQGGGEGGYGYLALILLVPAFLGISIILAIVSYAKAKLK